MHRMWQFNSCWFSLIFLSRCEQFCEVRAPYRSNPKACWFDTRVRSAANFLSWLSWRKWIPDNIILKRYGSEGEETDTAITTVWPQRKVRSRSPRILTLETGQRPASSEHFVTQHQIQTKISSDRNTTWATNSQVQTASDATHRVRQNTRRQI